MSRKGFFNLPIPADLRDTLKVRAAQERRPIYEVANEYMREMINGGSKVVMVDYGTVYVATKLEPGEMQQIKKDAARHNMSLSTYIREYYKTQLQHEKTE